MLCITVSNNRISLYDIRKWLGFNIYAEEYVYVVHQNVVTLGHLETLGFHIRLKLQMGQKYWEVFGSK